MFDNFSINVDSKKMMGYVWDVEFPDYVVCIIHGIGEHAGRYDRMASKMQENNIGVISMDLIGHGLSWGKRGHCAPRNLVLSNVDKLIMEAQKRYMGVPIILYGHSMGGNIGLDYRKRGELRDVPDAYVITGPWIQLEKKLNIQIMNFLKILAKVKPDLKLKAGIKNEELGNLNVINNQKNKELVHDYISARTILDGCQIGEELLHTQDKGKKLLLMHGGQDKICSVEGSRAFSKVAEDCEYVEWPEYYHEIHNGNWEKDGEKVIEYAIKWIKEKV